MRTKALLLAAAALAAGMITSQAQTVYSANIVGYVNQSLPAGQYQLVAPTLASTSTNAPEDVLPALTQGDEILFWTGSTYAAYTYVSPGQWIYPDGATVGAAPNLGNGAGFFYLNNSGITETNTTVGTVVLTNSVTLPAGVYTLVGSTPPVSSVLDGASLNLPLIQGDEVLLWDSAGSTYQAYTYVSSGQWIYPDGATVGAAPTLGVGQGFFYLNNSGASEVWTNNVTVQ